jgi:hypothetical protein
MRAYGRASRLSELLEELGRGACGCAVGEVEDITLAIACLTGRILTFLDAVLVGLAVLLLLLGDALDALVVVVLVGSTLG